MDKLGVLKEYFGHSAFREGQAEIIDAVLSGRDAFGIMPTSAGKSLCYQIPAVMSEGIALVVSPLISLMKDQVNSLIQSGVRAAYLNSSLNDAQFNKALANMANGKYKIVYIAPERLKSSRFIRADRQSLGVRVIEERRSKLQNILTGLIIEHVISVDDLQDFSEELRESTSRWIQTYCKNLES